MPTHRAGRRRTLADAVEAFLADYPQIWFACHLHHPRGPGAGRGLTERQATLLGHLERERGLPVGRLARHLSVTPGSMTVALARLERAGLVERIGAPGDRRLRPVHLTALGHRVQREQAGFDVAQVRAMLRRLPPARRARSLAGLALLADAARAIAKHRRQAPKEGRSRDRADHS